jgi:uncharacterized membrane protein YphA (DoxX/SURF4 family)
MTDMTTNEPAESEAGPAPDDRRTVVLDWVGTAARLVLGGVLLVAGLAKVADPVESVTAVRAYQLLPESMERLVGYGLPFLEIGVAVLLLVGFATRVAAIVGGLLMLGFVVGIVSAWARGLSIDCGCFGGGGTIDAADVDYVTPLLRDVGLVLIAGYLAWRPRSMLALDRRPQHQPAPEGSSWPAE